MSKGPVPIGRKLSYAKSNLSEEAIENLPEAKEQGKCDYEEVDFSGVGLSSEGLRTVMRICLRCQNLRVLKLFRNNIDDDGAEYLADLCEQRPGIEEIHLSHNRITERGIRRLITAAEHSRKRDQAPLWLRCEKNQISDPYELFQELSRKLNICKRADERKCATWKCWHNAKVHLPHFMMQDAAHRSGGYEGRQGGSWGYRDGENHKGGDSWSQWKNEEVERPKVVLLPARQAAANGHNSPPPGEWREDEARSPSRDERSPPRLQGRKRKADVIEQGYPEGRGRERRLMTGGDIMASGRARQDRPRRCEREDALDKQDFSPPPTRRRVRCREDRPDDFAASPRRAEHEGGGRRQAMPGLREAPPVREDSRAPPPRDAGRVTVGADGVRRRRRRVLVNPVAGGRGEALGRGRAVEASVDDRRPLAPVSDRHPLPAHAGDRRPLAPVDDRRPDPIRGAPTDSWRAPPQPAGVPRAVASYGRRPERPAAKAQLGMAPVAPRAAAAKAAAKAGVPDDDSVSYTSSESEEDAPPSINAAAPYQSRAVPGPPPAVPGRPGAPRPPAVPGTAPDDPSSPTFSGSEDEGMAMAVPHAPDSPSPEPAGPDRVPTPSSEPGSDTERWEQDRGCPPPSASRSPSPAGRQNAAAKAVAQTRMQQLKQRLAQKAHKWQA